MGFEEAAEDPAKFPFAGTSSPSPHFSPLLFYSPENPIHVVRSQLLMRLWS